MRREKWVEKRGRCFCLALLCGTHAAEEKRCCSVFVLDEQLQPAHLTPMNATLHFNMSACSQVCLYVKIWVLIKLTAPFIYHLFMLFLYFYNSTLAVCIYMSIVMLIFS